MLRQLDKEGKLKSVRVGEGGRYREEDLLGFLQVKVSQRV